MRLTRALTRAACRLELHEEAVAAYQRSLVAVYDPRFPGPSGEQLAAQRSRTRGHLGEAIAAYEAAVAVAPREQVRPQKVAVAASGAVASEAYTAHLNRANPNPDQDAYTAHLNRGVASYARHEMGAAAKAFGAAVAALPAHIPAHPEESAYSTEAYNHLAAALGKLSRHREASAQYPT